MFITGSWDRLSGREDDIGFKKVVSKDFGFVARLGNYLGVQ